MVRDEVTADRRLALTKDRKRIVEAGDPEAHSILAEAGAVIPQDEFDRLGLSVVGGRVQQGQGEAPTKARRRKGKKG